MIRNERTTIPGRIYVVTEGWMMEQELLGTREGDIGDRKRNQREHGSLATKMPDSSTE